MEAGVERKKIEIKNLWVNRGSPVQQIIGKILRNDEEQRRKKTEEQQFAIGIFRPDRAQAKNEQAAESRERKPSHERGSEVEQTKIHDGEEKCSRQDEQGVLPGRMDAQVNDNDAGERDAEKRGDQRFPVKLRAGAKPRRERDEQQSQQIFCGTVERHFLCATIFVVGAPR